MAVQDVAAFYRSVATTPELRQRVEAVSGRDLNEVAPRLITLAKEAGFSLNAEDLRAAARDAASSELSEEELERVAGGSYSPFGGGFSFFKWSSNPLSNPTGGGTTFQKV